MVHGDRVDHLWTGNEMAFCIYLAFALGLLIGSAAVLYPVEGTPWICSSPLHKDIVWTNEGTR